jgi:hypothetical protein
VTGIFYLLTYLGFWAPTLLAALARRAGVGVPLSLTAALALATAAITGSRRWRSDEPEACDATDGGRRRSNFSI